MPMPARLPLASLVATLIVTAVASACGPKAADNSATSSSTSGTSLQPTIGADSVSQLIDSVAADDSLIAHAAPAQIESLVPRHVQLVTHTLVLLQINRQKAGIADDPSWTATTDSVRADLRSMPSLSPTALTALLPAHVARVQRLIATEHKS